MGIGVNASISSGDIAAPGTTTTITKPAGTNNTDVLIVVFGSDRSSATAVTVTAPSGWTAVQTSVAQASGSTSVRLNCFWALGSVTNLGFTNANVTSPAADQGWVCVGFTGVDNTTPIDAAGTTSSTTGSTTCTANAVTTVTDQCWELIAACDWLSNAPGATGFTVKENAAANASAALFYNTTPKSVGSTGTVTVTWGTTATGEIICAMPFALRPAAAGGGGPPPGPFPFLPRAVLAV